MCAEDTVIFVCGSSAAQVAAQLTNCVIFSHNGFKQNFTFHIKKVCNHIKFNVANFTCLQVQVTKAAMMISRIK